MVNVQKRHLFVLFAENEENRVKKVREFQKVEEVGIEHNSVADPRQILFWFGNSEQTKIFLRMRFAESLKCVIKIQCITTSNAPLELTYKVEHVSIRYNLENIVNIHDAVQLERFSVFHPFLTSARHEI